MNTKLPASISFAFIRVLVAGAESGRSYTITELAERLEIAGSTAWKWVKALRELELIYVAEWRRSGRLQAACYAWGFKEDDAPRPAPLTQHEHERNYRQRKRLAKASGIERMAL